MKESKKSPSSFIDQMSKEFSKIYASCNKAKQTAMAEMGKIDEKYRRMAEEEKKSITEFVKKVDEQLEMYAGYLGLDKGEEVTETPEPAPVEGTPDMTPQEPEKEEEIVDTIFPDNLDDIEEKKEEEVVEEKKGLTKEDIIEGLEAAGIRPVEEVIAEESAEQPEWTSTDPTEDWPVEEQSQEEEKKEPILVTDDESGWPEFPAEWK